tara:strand:+ start:953 stop:1240 length:288 start_codon:yes stop_codon:yes gene_type:complete
MAAIFPVATFGDIAGSFIMFPCHMNVLVGSSAEIQPAAMPGSMVMGHGLPPHSSPVITAVFPTTVRINNMLIRTVGDLASCGDPISTGAWTVLST